MNNRLSDSESKKRNLILNGNMWYALLYLGTPLAFYQIVHQLFKIYDSMMASSISSMAVASVTYLSQLSLFLTAIGTGLSMGSSMKISEAYGAGDYDLVSRRVNSLFKICAIISVFILAIIPFTSSFLRVMGTPEDFIAEGTLYFAVTLVDNAIVIVNSSYIALERVRGNSGRILKLNICGIIIKLVLSTIFILVLDMGIAMMAVATIVSDLIVFGAFIYYMCYKNKESVFFVNQYNLRIDRPATGPMIKISLPVLFEKLAFQYGKVWVNILAADYGSLVSGALGVSSNIGGTTTTAQVGYQGAGAAIISQNIGAGNKRRSLEAFYKLCIINLAVGAFGLVITLSYIDFFIQFFDGGDAYFAELIKQTLYCEACGIIPIGIFSSVSALLYGYGYTKITLVLNFSRLFVFRIPILWYLKTFTDVGALSAGLVLAISNVAISIVSGIVAVFVVRRIKLQIGIDENASKV